MWGEQPRTKTLRSGWESHTRLAVVSMVTRGRFLWTDWGNKSDPCTATSSSRSHTKVLVTLLGFKIDTHTSSRTQVLTWHPHAPAATH